MLSGVATTIFNSNFNPIISNYKKQKIDTVREPDRAMMETPLDL